MYLFCREHEAHIVKLPVLKTRSCSNVYFHSVYCHQIKIDCTHLQIVGTVALNKRFALTLWENTKFSWSALCSVCSYCTWVSVSPVFQSLSTKISMFTVYLGPFA